MQVHKYQFQLYRQSRWQTSQTQQASHKMEFLENKAGTIYIYKVHVQTIELAICHCFLKPEVNYLQILKCHLLLQS
jgi:hypothetical protein